MSPKSHLCPPFRQLFLLPLHQHSKATAHHLHSVARKMNHKIEIAEPHGIVYERSCHAIVVVHTTGITCVRKNVPSPCEKSAATTLQLIQKISKRDSKFKKCYLCPRNSTPPSPVPAPGPLPAACASGESWGFRDADGEDEEEGAVSGREQGELPAATAEST